MQSTEELLEQMFSMGRKEVQSLEIKQGAKGVIYWEIKMYGLRSEFAKLANIVAAIDLKCRRAYHSENGPIPSNVTLSPFNKLKDPVLKVELGRSAKGDYHITTKSVSLPNDEDVMIKIDQQVRSMIKNILKIQ